MPSKSFWAQLNAALSSLEDRFKTLCSKYCRSRFAQNSHKAKQCTHEVGAISIFFLPDGNCRINATGWCKDSEIVATMMEQNVPVLNMAYAQIYGVPKAKPRHMPPSDVNRMRSRQVGQLLNEVLQHGGAVVPQLCNGGQKPADGVDFHLQFVIGPDGICGCGGSCAAARLLLHYPKTLPLVNWRSANFTAQNKEADALALWAKENFPEEDIMSPVKAQVRSKPVRADVGPSSSIKETAAFKPILKQRSKPASINVSSEEATSDGDDDEDESTRLLKMRKKPAGGTDAGLTWLGVPAVKLSSDEWDDESSESSTSSEEGPSLMERRSLACNGRTYKEWLDWYNMRPNTNPLDNPLDVYGKEVTALYNRGGHHVKFAPGAGRRPASLKKRKDFTGGTEDGTGAQDDSCAAGGSNTGGMGMRAGLLKRRNNLTGGTAGGTDAVAPDRDSTQGAPSAALAPIFSVAGPMVLSGHLGAYVGKGPRGASDWSNVPDGVSKDEYLRYLFLIFRSPTIKPTGLPHRQHMLCLQQPSVLEHAPDSRIFMMNDEVVNCYGDILKTHVAFTSPGSVFILGSHFLSNLRKDGPTATSLLLKKLDFRHLPRKLLAPYHVGIHWTAVEVHFEERCIRYYDSLKNNASIAAAGGVLDMVWDWLAAAYLLKNKIVDKDDWTLVPDALTVEEAPQDIGVGEAGGLTGVDCGLFALMYIHCLAIPTAGVALESRFGQGHMRGLRVHLLAALFSAKPMDI